MNDLWYVHVLDITKCYTYALSEFCIFCEQSVIMTHSLNIHGV